MDVKLISVKCPECGATLNIEEGREQAFCTYCGAKVLLHNENEYIYRHIDDAEVKQAETDRMVRMKQMELVEKKMAEAEKTKALKIKIAIIVAIVGVLMMVIGIIGGSTSGDSGSGLGILAMMGFFLLLVAGLIVLVKKDDDNEIIPGDKATVPSSISDYEKKSYNAIEAMFVGAGFTNVRCVALNDLTVGFLKKPGMVESITINGSTVKYGGSKYPKDAAVVISYHSLNR